MILGPLAAVKSVEHGGIVVLAPGVDVQAAGREPPPLDDFEQAANTAAAPSAAVPPRNVRRVSELFRAVGNEGANVIG